MVSVIIWGAYVQLNQVLSIFIKTYKIFLLASTVSHLYFSSEKNTLNSVDEAACDLVKRGNLSFLWIRYKITSNIPKFKFKFGS